MTTTYEDVIRVPLETGAAEGIALEDNLRKSNDIKLSGIMFNRTTDTDEKIVDEQTGERIVIDATNTSDEYIVLEDGVGETAGSAIVYEQQDIFVSPRIVLQYAATNGTTGNICLEDGIDSVTNPDAGILLSEADAVSYTNLTLPTICSV